MNTENFLELMTINPTSNVLIAKTSIAAIETTSTGCVVTLKEKRKDGLQISFDVALTYNHLIEQINIWEKLSP